MFGFELVKAVDEDELAAPFVGDLLEDAGEGIAQGGTTLTGQEEVGEVMLENEAGHQVAQEDDLVVGSRSEGDEVVGDTLKTALLLAIGFDQGGDDAAFALAGLAGDGEVASCRQQLIYALAHFF